MSPLITPLPLLAEASSNSALISFGIYTLFVLFLAWLSNRVAQGKSFLSEYFLGSRKLGVWAFALTLAATNSSGGSFMGFPAKIYSHGWILALWIGSYMIVPLFVMGLISKRLNQVARKTGAITIPDVMRDRFESAKLGALATLLIVFFMAVNLVAQFKAGSKILSTLLDDVPVFQTASAALASFVERNSIPIGTEGAGYVLCLLVFALAVIVYTAYGGFRAVVWTDVMQGVVMVGGVLLMLPLAINAVGGLPAATEKMSRMTPPQPCQLMLRLEADAPADRIFSKGTWVLSKNSDSQKPQLFRMSEESSVTAGTRAISNAVGEDRDIDYLLAIEITTQADIETVLRDIDLHSRSNVLRQVHVEYLCDNPYAYGANKPGVYVTGPGPSSKNEDGFLPFSLAISFFFMWCFAGTGAPSNMVRMMAFRDTATLRRSIVMVAIYYSLIYFPLVIIFCCARVMLPGWEVDPDRIMPEMAKAVSFAAGHPWLAGLLVAAPFAAVMSTVDSFLLMISSAVVRDVYQRNINPQASEKTIKRLTYIVTVIIGTAAIAGALYPPAYLQDIIVFTGSGLAACFLMPVVLALYWPRFNASGAIAGMAAGFLFHCTLYAVGTSVSAHFQAYRIFDFDPIVPELLVSSFAAIVATRLSARPPQRIVQKFFGG